MPLVYGFYDECHRKYGSSAVWRYCCEVFDYLALAAIVDGRVFCVHGGLSPNLHSIDHVRHRAVRSSQLSTRFRRSERSIESKRFLTMVQCVTCFGQIRMVRRFRAHPIRRGDHFAYFIHLDIQGWGLSPRGAGFLFGGDVVKQFARANDIDLIARAHQLAMEGYKLMFDKLIVTVWSAPNYCYRCVLFLYGNLHTTEQANHLPSHVRSQLGAEMSLRSWNWTRIYARNTESLLMRLRYVCLTPLPQWCQ